MKQLSNKQLITELEQRLLSFEKSKEETLSLQKTLSDLNYRLIEAEALKSHFISNVSNEIINPFTSVLALAENILSVDKENWKKVVSMVALIHSEVFNLDFQLKNIFSAAKIEAGDITPEISLIDIDSLLKNLIKSFVYEAKRKNLTINFEKINENIESTIYFKSDCEKIRLILANLLSNAIKFSYSEGVIKIRITKKSKSLIMEVEDFGQGISSSNEKIIFDRFKRLDSGINSINRGHGLGLSINKALIDLLNGQISHVSSLGKGTKFTVTIPEATEESTGISTDANEIFFKEETF